VNFLLKEVYFLMDWNGIVTGIGNWGKRLGLGIGFFDGLRSSTGDTDLLCRLEVFREIEVFRPFYSQKKNGTKCLKK
jgi:hypothetical protein